MWHGQGGDSLWRRLRARAPRGGIALLLAIGGLATGRAPGHAQIGIYDALARRFSDVSFFVNAGGLAPASDHLRDGRLTSYGIEVLLEVGGVARPLGPPPTQQDSVALIWTEMQVVRSGSRVDTTHTYEVQPIVQRAPMEPIWTFEVGVGYGQLTGLESRTPGLDLKGAVRDLPTLSLYATYEPLAAYFGVRSGFMKLQGLQVFDDEGSVWSGDAESFLAGATVGRFFEILSITLFFEGAYTWRDFPSVRWSGPSPLPSGLPRSLEVSGWTVGTGLQFGVGGS